MTYAELEYGVSAANDPEKERQHLVALVEDLPVAPFDRAAGCAYGPIRQATRDRRKNLDKLIAAHAVSLDVVLITNNLKDFARYPGLKTENWVESP